MSDDITFCMNGWNECGVTRCFRHPHNIVHKDEPHSFANFYGTDICPLDTPKKEKMLVHCKDCAYADSYYQCQNVMFYTSKDDYCSRGKLKDE